MTSIGNKKIFSANLQALMRQHGKERQQVCDDLGLKYSTFSDWYNGNKYPRIDKIELLANYFGVEKSDLIEAPFQKTTARGVRIPVFASVPAGIPLEAIEDVVDFEEIPSEMAKNGEYFSLRVTGDSMEPRIKEGDVVIARRQEAVDNGDLAVVMVNSSDATLKRFYRTETGVKLVSSNPKYDPFFFTPAEVEQLPVRVLGKVVELRAKF